MSDSDPVFVPMPSARDGFLLFLREGSLLAQGFDAESRELKGEAKPIAENVGTTGSYGWFSASSTGALAFRAAASAGNSELHWVDRQGKLLGQIGPAFGWRGNLQLSPDGKRVVVSRGDASSGGQLPTNLGSHVWIAELSRGIFSRLNSGQGTESSPAISPDGQVAFTSTLGGAIGDLYRMSANGIGTPEPLLTKSPTVKHPNGFSPDGRFLIFDDHTAQRQDLLILPMEPAAVGERKPIPFLVTAADETFGQFSPDGKWIAYSSDESGRREVYVQGFAPDRVPAAAVGKWTISTAGGDKPRWSRDGKELYYIAPDRRMMAVPFKIGSTFEPGIAIPLFPVRVVGFSPYDVAPDGRFLLLTPSDAEQAAASPLTVVLDWQAALKQ
jgi:Tol biopolymer transport system component